MPVSDLPLLRWPWPLRAHQAGILGLIENAIVDVIRWRERLRRVGLEPLEMQVTDLHHELMLLKLQHTMRHA